MLGEVEAVDFRLVVHPQAGHGFRDHQDDHADHQRPGDGDGDRCQLHHELRARGHAVGKAKAADVQQMQTVLVDLDAGDIAAKLDHLIRHLGEPTLLVESGGRTPDGLDKLHVWWRLSEPAEGEDIALLCRLRGDIAVKVGGDTHFRSAHQPIRLAGSVYHKGGFKRLVNIRRHSPRVEVHLRDFAEAVADMPPLAGVGSEPGPSTDKPSITDILTTPVREGGEDDWTRFQGASAAIGHYVRMAHEGRMSRDDAWEAICQYNAAQLRPSWPLERLASEAQRLWRLHEERHGPALERIAVPPMSALPVFTLGALLDDTSPMPDDIIAPRLLTPEAPYDAFYRAARRTRETIGRLLVERNTYSQFWDVMLFYNGNVPEGEEMIEVASVEADEGLGPESDETTAMYRQEYCRLVSTYMRDPARADAFGIEGCN